MNPQTIRSRIRALSWNLLVLAGLVAAPVGAQTDRAAYYERELLLAQIEDLTGRLGSGPLPAATGGLVLELGAPEGAQTQAGQALERLTVHLSGRPAEVLAWLAAAIDQRIAVPSLPLSAHTEGYRVVLEGVVWRLGAGPWDRTAAGDALTRLRDNLLWLEGRLEDSRRRLPLLALALDAEGVRLERLSWAGARLRLAGRAPEEPTRAAWAAALESRRAAWPRQLHLDVSEVRVDTPAEMREPAGLDLRAADPAAVLLVAAERLQRDLVLAGGERPPLNGHFQLDDPQSLLGELAARAGLRLEERDGVLVLSRDLSGDPPPAPAFGERTVDLRFLREPPDGPWQLLAAVGQVGLLTPDPQEAPLSLILRGRPASRAASLLAWVLGRQPAGDARLTWLQLPGTSPGLPPLPSAPAGQWQLIAVAAPLTELVRWFGRLEAVTVCGPPSTPVTVRSGRLPAAELVMGLLAGRDRRLHLEGHSGCLVASGCVPGSGSCRVESAPAGPRLAALVSGPDGTRALVADDGRWRWLGPGDALSDGRRVRRARGARLRLRSPDGSDSDLGFETPPALTSATRRDPSAVPLSALRLMATWIPGGAAPGIALLVGAEGETFTVVPGDLVGRRCGKVTAITPGRLHLALGCAGASDPPRAVLSLPGP